LIKKQTNFYESKKNQNQNISRPFSYHLWLVDVLILWSI